MQRRDFLIGALKTGALVHLGSSGLFARSLSAHSLNALPAARPVVASDRILVLINLNGGNDGLNTIVPVDDARYYNARPTLAQKKETTLPIAAGYGLHSSLPEIQQLWSDGRCAIVQNVGYPEQNRSHFRSTDIWHSASHATQFLSTGWMGRYLGALYPGYPPAVPDAPFAIQISSSTTLLQQGPGGSMGASIDNPAQFYDLATGLTLDPEPPPATLAGNQLRYVRQVMIEADTFTKGINRAMQQGASQATYADDSLGAQLKVVARLISGGLGTNIYVVSLGGFDTHYGQADPHTKLLRQLSQGVGRFMEDIGKLGYADRVVCMTYSEFGRRVEENGSVGTDHGAAAPQLFFGTPVRGGRMLGGTPDLGALDERGDLLHSVDFRQLYATLLLDWLGFDRTETETVLGGAYETLPIFDAPGSVDDRHRPAGGGARFDGCTPNPVAARGELFFTIAEPGHVRLHLLSTDGRTIGTLLDDHLPAGPHRLPFDATGLAAGKYLGVLDAAGRRMSRGIEVVR